MTLRAAQLIDGQGAVTRRLAEAAIQSTPAGGDFFRVQRVPFRLPEAADVEPRVKGGDATLWLDRVVFLPSRGEGE